MGIPRVPWPLVWAVLQLGWRPGRFPDAHVSPWSPLAFSPARLAVPEGANATFTCSFSSTSKGFVLNWYRMSPSNQTDKLAAFPEDSSQPGRDRRFRVTPLPNGRDFHMSVVAAQRNDSGIYLCGAIYLLPNMQITESPLAELTVTEPVLELPTEHPSPPPGSAPLQVVGVTSILLSCLLVFLLLACALAAAFPRDTGGPCTGRSLDEPLKEGPSTMPVFTVDYAELDFQWREKTPEPPAPHVPEQTEYATIVFPSRPVSPGRRASADSPTRPRPPRTEDGHCSWPL
ncbi:programmed cell death protein 1 [Manis pentadactyla]|uniref:programmed cell death protein 1 n=1 Tax=Manis pentadactyla TaxID=143292 RepID=UPI001876E8A8|nr:programmed cell death protein 1 [Manis pentadactyla]KAI5281382.1 Programmed Cell Death Protein 1 [Manis pentadactyla]